MNSWSGSGLVFDESRVGQQSLGRKHFKSNSESFRLYCGSLLFQCLTGKCFDENDAYRILVADFLPGARA